MRNRWPIVAATALVLVGALLAWGLASSGEVMPERLWMRGFRLEDGVPTWGGELRRDPDVANTRLGDFQLGMDAMPGVDRMTVNGRHDGIREWVEIIRESPSRPSADYRRTGVTRDTGAGVWEEWVRID